MKRYKVLMQYNGSYFHGWQKQNNALTIQGDIESVLSKIHKHDVSIFGSGRTDAKVHALGQVFHFDSSLELSQESWIKALNATCHYGISILDVCEVEHDFHARYSAKGKHYQYRLETDSFNVFEQDYIYQYNQVLDIEAMRNAAQIFVGTHDFSSFNANSKEELLNQVRTISSFEITEVGSKIFFDLKGDGFMRYMVRMLVAGVVAVGKKKITKEDLIRIMEAKDKQAASFNIDACGLYLIEVYY